MKFFFVLVCCFTIPIIGRAEQVQNQKKHPQKRPQHLHQGQTGTRHHNRAVNHPAQTGVTTLNGETHQQNNVVKEHEHHVKNGNQVAGQHLNKREFKHFETANNANSKIESAKFQANHHIEGSEKWHGDKYVVFQNYHPEWHDHDWWHHHYDRVILISGGWYFWNAGFWYPAWGYDSAYSYYPYDGPIYATSHILPPDQVIANVQSALQEQGFYRGEVDGLLGPLTRAALAEYQQAQGLTTTAAIDEPTLDSLGLS